MQRAGATLLEVIVCSVLMLIIAGGVYTMMVAGARYFRVTNATIEVQESSLAALARLTQELGESDPRTMGVTDNCLVFASPRDNEGRLHFQGGSRLLWQKYVSYYQSNYNGTPCLLRKEALLGQPTVTPPAAPPLATALRDDGNLTPSVVARNIVAVQYTGANPLDMSVTAEIKDSGKDFQVKLSSRVLLKN